MATIAYMNGAADPAHRRAPHLAAVTAAAAPEPRRIEVPNSALKLLQRAQIQAPEWGGRLSVAEVDAKMQTAGLTTAERLAVKLTLKNAGCL